MKNITISILEATSSQKTFYTPRYATIKKLFKNSKITVVDNFKKFDIQNYGTQLNNIDFQNFDGDFFYISDDVPIDYLLSYNDRFEEYFKYAMILYQIDSNVFDKNSRNLFNKSGVINDNEKSAFKIIQSLFHCDLFLATDYIWEIMKKEMSYIFSKDAIEKLEQKCINVPTPGVYRFENEFINKDYSSLNFLWNHRLVPEKRFDIFVNILSEFKTKYPSIPITITICSTNKAKTLKKVPENLHDVLNIIDFVRTDEEYKQLLRDTNISLGTSEAESFGISAMEFIKFGSVYLNLNINKAFSYYIGSETTFNQSTLVDKIADIYNNKEYRDSVLNYNKENFLKNIPSESEYVEKIMSALEKKFIEKITDNDITDLIEKALKIFDHKKVCVKKDIYEAFGWGDPDATKWWYIYFYKLRAAGVYVIYKDDKIYFTKTDREKLTDEDFNMENNKNVTNFFEF